MSDQIKDAPAFDFYPERWLVGTAHMTDAEQLAYLRLLCHQWMMQGLPDDLPTLKRLAGRGVTPAVLAKLPVDAADGRRRNARLEVIRAEQRERIKRRSEQRKAAANARWAKSACETDAVASPPALRAQCPPPTTHHPPQLERENAGEPELDAIERIVAAYPLQDAPMECRESVRMCLDSGEDAQRMLAAVQACAVHIRLAPQGSANRFVPTARNFFQREQWRSPEKFQKLSQSGAASKSPTAHVANKPPGNGWGSGTEAPWVEGVES